MASHQDGNSLSMIATFAVAIKFVVSLRENQIPSSSTSETRARRKSMCATGLASSLAAATWTSTSGRVTSQKLKAASLSQISISLADYLSKQTMYLTVMVRMSRNVVVVITSVKLVMVLCQIIVLNVMNI